MNLRPPEADPSTTRRREIARAARILAVRSRRQTAGPLLGGYASAFRGGGMEYEESRPYVPGDDVRGLDWNALARTGEPFVKRFREERNRTLLLVVDGSPSMGFGTVGRSKAEVAAHSAGLIAAAAARAGDRVGLLALDPRGNHARVLVGAGRGDAHTWRVIEAAATWASELGLPASPLATGPNALSKGPSPLSKGPSPLPHLVERLAEGRSIVVLLSDFRWIGCGEADAAGEGERACLADAERLARRHELVAVGSSDPREERLPPVGLVRFADPEDPHHTLLLDTGHGPSRARYAAAARARRHAVARRLRGLGCDLVWIRSDRDPLRALIRFFHGRSAHGPRVTQ